MMLRVLDLFSGIGGFSLGLERTGGFETVAFCEIEEFPRKVLAKHWPDVPQFEDVRQLKGQDIGPVDVICGGYPCQPFSAAGKRQGAADDRHLWPEVARLLDELRPSWFVGENVAGHISMGLDSVFDDMESLNYTARAFVIPACAVGLSQRRNRVWIVANNGGNSDYFERPVCQSKIRMEKNGVNEVNIWCKLHRTLESASSSRSKEALESVFCGDVHGVSERLDRIKALGNAVVPQIPEMIGRAILEAETIRLIG